MTTTCVGPAGRKCAYCGAAAGGPCLLVMPRQPKILDAIADRILAHKPKAKSKPAKKRARRAKKIAQAADA